MNQPATVENELRMMLGDLLLQVAALRAENANLKVAQSNEDEREATKLNGSQQPAAPPPQ